MPQYTHEVGRKFQVDGQARPFAGNTIISFVPPQSHIFALAEWIQAQVRSQSFAHKFVFLPPGSFHMTVMDLLCDQRRIAERWIPALSLDAPLAETNNYFIEALTSIKPPPLPLRMGFSSMARKSFAINLMPANSATEQALKTYRNAITSATGVRAPNHDHYQFHISLAYRLIHLTDLEEIKLDQLLTVVDERLQAEFGIFELPAPQLTFFENMFHFTPITLNTTHAKPGKHTALKPYSKSELC